MSEINILMGKCDGCGRCITSCPFNCLNLVNGKAFISNDCRLCGICVESCPTNAIDIRMENKKNDLSEYRGVLIFGEQRQGIIATVVYELIGKGTELAKKLHEDLNCVVLGENMKAQSEDLSKYDVDNVYVFDNPLLSEFRDDPYTEILTNLVKKIKPRIFLIGATSLGRSLAPRIAAKLKTGLTADCTELDINSNGDLIQTRPAYGGNILATIICPSHRPQMATVRYKVMKSGAKNLEYKGRVITKNITDKILDRTKIKRSFTETEEVSIAEAEIIVSGGKGLGNPEGFKLIKELADALGGTVGASRLVVDEGWIHYRHQVGLSGKTVRPKLYIACGISGAIQHLAGMQTSDIIVAINKDPSAPIIKIADFSIIGDLYEVIPEIVKLVKNQNRKEEK